MTRRVTIHTPLGEQLHFRELRGQENISQLFSLDVEILSESESIHPKALFGKKATTNLCRRVGESPSERKRIDPRPLWEKTPTKKKEPRGGGGRFTAASAPRSGRRGRPHRHYAYKARLSPWLWLATRKSDFR